MITLFHFKIFFVTFIRDYLWSDSCLLNSAHEPYPTFLHPYFAGFTNYITVTTTKQSKHKIVKIEAEKDEIFHSFAHNRLSTNFKINN